MPNISKKASIGSNTVICEGVIIEDNVTIGDNCYVDYHTIIKENVNIGDNTFIGANCILGEFLMDFYQDRINKQHPLSIGSGCLIRSGSIFYGGCTIGEHFQCGHHVSVRENSTIGCHTSVGTLGDIQGNCEIGEYVHLHSNVFVAPHTIIGNYCWIFGGVVITNDPTPPSDVVMGAKIDDFAVLCAGAVLLPGVHVGKDALVGAGCILTKDVPEGRAFVGNPGKDRCAVSEIKNRENGEQVYPWRYTFTRGTPWSDTDYETWRKQIDG
jgi:acetyltransferase-like isoleucine patch superfamily enzyme